MTPIPEHLGAVTDWVEGRIMMMMMMMVVAVAVAVALSGDACFWLLNIVEAYWPWHSASTLKRKIICCCCSSCCYCSCSCSCCGVCSCCVFCSWSCCCCCCWCCCCCCCWCCCCWLEPFWQHCCTSNGSNACQIVFWHSTMTKLHFALISLFAWTLT